MKASAIPRWAYLVLATVLAAVVLYFAFPVIGSSTGDCGIATGPPSLADLFESGARLLYVALLAAACIAICRLAGRKSVALRRAEALFESGDHEAVIALCSAETTRLRAEGADSPSARRVLVELLGLEARSLWSGRRDLAGAIERCAEANSVAQGKKLRKPIDEQFAFIRQMEDLDGSRARSLQLVCRGRALLRNRDGVEVEMPYALSYVVLADSPEEGLEFARRLEPAEWRASLGLTKANAVELARADKRGVYRRSGRIFAEVTSDSA